VKGSINRLKIIIEELPIGEEEQIIVRCRKIRPELMRVLNTLKAQNDMLVAYINSEVYRIDIADIFYIEAVDNKTFLYCENQIYESKHKLYELEEVLGMSDFLRVSKSVIVNLNEIKSLLPALSGRLDAVLRNGEKISISRQYVSELKKNLGI